MYSQRRCLTTQLPYLVAGSSQPAPWGAHPGRTESSLALHANLNPRALGAMESMQRRELSLIIYNLICLFSTKKKKAVSEISS